MSFRDILINRRLPVFRRMGQTVTFVHTVKHLDTRKGLVDNTDHSITIDHALVSYIRPEDVVGSNQLYKATDRKFRVLKSELGIIPKVNDRIIHEEKEYRIVLIMINQSDHCYDFFGIA
jgi:hypothetical protein